MRLFPSGIHIRYCYSGLFPFGLLLQWRLRASQERAAYIGVVQQCLRLALVGVAAQFEDVAPVAGFETLAGVLFDHEDGQAVFAVEAPDVLEDHAGDQRGETGARLVHHHDLRFQHQRAADLQHALFAAGHCAGHLAAPLCQAREQLEDVLDALADARLVVLQIHAHFQILYHSHLRKDAAQLGDDGDAGAEHVLGAGIGDLLPVEADDAPWRTLTKP